MCGIGGYVGGSYSQEQLKHYLACVIDKIKHRGPDEDGLWVGSSVGLCAVRLAIRDPKSGQQPLSRNGVQLVYNGEIYNVDNLRHLLGREAWQSQSDTELILEGYLQWGKKIISLLDGMFALAIWDEQEKTLLLARDRWGQKPLYYAIVNGEIAFASEISGLMPWSHINWSIDEGAISTFMTHSYIPTPHTGWQGIKKLPPGHLIQWKKEQYHLSPYEKNCAHTEQDLFERVMTNVERCAASDRPLGVFLSGGIDSSTVCAILAKLGYSFSVFGVDWIESSHSEGDYARLLCNQLGLKLTPVVCRPAFMVEKFDEIVCHLGELLGDESIIPTACIAERAKRDVDVVLTGDGADEFFMGYEKYFYTGNDGPYEDVFSVVRCAERQQLFSQTFQDIQPLRFRLPPKLRPGVRARSDIDILNYLPDNILHKIDRMTMRVGLEARAPFLTDEVTQLALQTSDEQLYRKKVLRKAVANLLPGAIIHRKKMGFGVPLGSWFETDLNQWLKERCFSGQLERSGWFQMCRIEHMCKNPKKYSRVLFNLLVLERWLDLHT